MFILKKGHQPGVYVPLRALFLVWSKKVKVKERKSGNYKEPANVYRKVPKFSDTKIFCCKLPENSNKAAKP